MCALRAFSDNTSDCPALRVTDSRPAAAAAAADDDDDDDDDHHSWSLCDVVKVVESHSHVAESPLSHVYTGMYRYVQVYSGIYRYVYLVDSVQYSARLQQQQH